MRDTDSKVPELHYYDWSLTRWFTSDTHDILDAAGRGIYRELLDRCYAQGRIPSDPVILARMCRATEADFASTWTLIRRHFQVDKHDGSYLRNTFADAFRSRFFRFKKSQREKGARGGTRKAQNIKTPVPTKSNIISEIPSSGLATSLAVAKPDAKPEPSQNSTPLHSTPLHSIPNGAANSPRTVRPPDSANGWHPDPARFLSEYPGKVRPDADARLYVSYITSESLEQTLFRHLAKWKTCDQWREGFIESAGKWLETGCWKVAPKNIPKARKPDPPDFVPEQ